MSDPLERCVTLLADLIGYRTDNPRGDERALCSRLADALRARGADDVALTEVPRESGVGAYVYARFGTPRLLINAHVDTVPPNTGWSRDPFVAEHEGERVVGLGAADTKGAIAAVLTALDQVTPKDVGVLFSGDEEVSTTCVRAFVKTEAREGLERALVCEPSARRAGVRHRGVCGYRARSRGLGGHSSRADYMPKPVVTLARLAVELDELGRRYLEQGPQDMKGICMNVASLEGGVAFNVVPDGAELTWSVRAPPGFDQETFLREQQACIDRVDPDIELTTVLDHRPFACEDPDGFAALLGDRIEAMVPLDFWTEAAVLSRAGVDAVVLGPGDIAQAHTADEFVEKGDLKWAVDLFTHVFEECRRAPA